MADDDPAYNFHYDDSDWMGVLPPQIRDEIGLDDGTQADLVGLNYFKRASFAEIADEIEHRL